MAVESVTYINSLDPNLPSGADTLLETDDHIRNLKFSLRNTFPNLRAPVTATADQLNSPFPIGGIIIWSGAVNAVPAGWALCNGQTVGRSDGQGTITTPNLQDRFVVGAGANYPVGQTGGSASIYVVTAEGGAHGHGAGCSGAGQHAHGGAVTQTSLGIDHIPPHSHGYSSAIAFSGQGGGLYNPSPIVVQMADNTTSTVGGGQPHNHLIAADGHHAHTIEVYGVGNHQHGVSLPDTRPPYFALAYILKF